MPDLKPIDRFELTRMVHARAQELDIPGSPAGRNGHPQLSFAAKHNYGVKSWNDLNVHQMRAIYDFLDAHKRMPVRGELK